MTDSHAHISMQPILDDIENILHDFTSKGGTKILNASYDLPSINQVILDKISMSNIFPDLILTSVGIHPEEFIPTTLTNHNDSPLNQKFDSFEKMRKALDEYNTLVNKNIKHISAIGETGLDYHYFINSDNEEDSKLTTDQIEELIEIQKNSFIEHIEIAKKKSLPMTIHSRENFGENRCIKDVLNLLCTIGNGKIAASIHSYTGDIDLVDEIIDLGYYIGFNAILTYKSGENIRQIASKTPLERILLETDCPSLPLHIKGAQKYGTPSDIGYIASVLAEIKNISTEKLLSIVDENFNRIFCKTV